MLILPLVGIEAIVLRRQEIDGADQTPCQNFVDTPGGTSSEHLQKFSMGSLQLVHLLICIRLGGRVGGVGVKLTAVTLSK